MICDCINVPDSYVLLRHSDVVPTSEALLSFLHVPNESIRLGQRLLALNLLHPHSFRSLSRLILPLPTNIQQSILAVNPQSPRAQQTLNIHFSARSYEDGSQGHSRRTHKPRDGASP